MSTVPDAGGGAGATPSDDGGASVAASTISDVTEPTHTSDTHTIHVGHDNSTRSDQSDSGSTVNVPHVDATHIHPINDDTADVDVDVAPRNTASAARADDAQGAEGAAASAPVSIGPDHLECPLCLRLLHQPVTTTCGHSFCSHCLCQAAVAASKTRAEAKCPICRSVCLRICDSRAAAEHFYSCCALPRFCVTTLLLCHVHRGAPCLSLCLATAIPCRIVVSHTTRNRRHSHHRHHQWHRRLRHQTPPPSRLHHCHRVCRCFPSEGQSTRCLSTV